MYLRIDLPIVDMKSRTNTHCKECYLVLTKENIQYKVVADYISSDNDEAIPKEVVCNFRWTRRRDNLSNIEMYYDNIEELWGVSMEFGWVTGTCAWYWDDPKEALKIYSQLSKYLMKEI